jgi:hypothetical protein
MITNSGSTTPKRSLVSVSAAADGTNEDDRNILYRDGSCRRAALGGREADDSVDKSQIVRTKMGY